MTNVGIKGSGIYLPEKKVGNEELERLLGFEKGTIESKTGIKERRWSNKQETVEYMASQAALQAVKDANVENIERIIIARDVIATRRAYSIGLPIMQALENKGIKVTNCTSLDICNYCPGFVHGLNIAHLMVQARQAENALIIASTNYTDLINTESDFNKQFSNSFNSSNASVLQYSLHRKGQYQAPALNAFLWGCGAGAMVVGKTQVNKILGFETKSSRNLKCDAYGVGEANDGKLFASLDGKGIYKYAMTEVPQFIERFLERLHLRQRDIDVLIPHQPNPRILENLAARLEISREKMLVSCDTLGNMIAASTPITYHLGKESEKIKDRNTILFCSFGDSYLTTSGIIVK